MQTNKELKKAVEKVMQDNILFIGAEIPEALLNDPRAKYIVLGTPHDLLRLLPDTNDTENHEQ